MQIIRTITWVVIALLLLVFVTINWRPVQVTIWPLETNPVFVQWPLGLVVLVAFFVGLAPMWLWSQGARWRLRRRISALENSVRAVTPSPPLATYETDTVEHHEP